MKPAQAIANSSHIKRQITERQAQQLFGCAQMFNQDGALCLDIGTFHGFSASIIAQAAPRAMIISLNPSEAECIIARKNLDKYMVQVVCVKSWDYLEKYEGKLFDFIFVDGDHNSVKRDLGWWEHLKTGGLMLFHDYNTPGHRRDSAILRATLDAFSEKLGQRFDIHAKDEPNGVGMVGLYRWSEHNAQSG